MYTIIESGILMNVLLVHGKQKVTYIQGCITAYITFPQKMY